MINVCEKPLILILNSALIKYRSLHKCSRTMNVYLKITGLTP